MEALDGAGGGSGYLAGSFSPQKPLREGSQGHLTFIASQELEGHRWA